MGGGGNLSNGTVMSYQGTVNRIKQHPIGKRKLKTVTADHLQAYIYFLSFGGTNPDGYNRKGTQQRVSPIVFDCFARGVPFCGIPEKDDNL